MKNIILTITVLLALACTACEDFLTVESPDQLTSEKFWRNQSDAESGLAAAYSKLEHSDNTWGFAEVRWPVEAYREDLIDPGADAMNYLNWVELSNFTYTNGNSQFNSYWENIYRGINYANQVIEKVPTIAADQIDEAARAQILNEAYFLRGYYHMKLILNWEQVINRDFYIVTASVEELSGELATRVATWDLIISDLTKAKELPATLNIDQVGRATKGAANAYLGFAFLTRAYEESGSKQDFLTKALTHLEDVKGYSLVKDFRGMFDGTNQNSSEVVFELQFSMNSANGANYKTQMHKWIASSELGGWDEILPTEKLINEYKKEGKIATTGRYDTRAYETLFFDDPYFNGTEDNVYGYPYTEIFGENGRAVFRKLLPATLDEMNASRVGYNIPLMRYANVLLMKAEALNELGRGSEAIPYINEIREIHGDMPPVNPTTKEAIHAQIEHERILEFPLENLRFYDLRRWGTATDALHGVGRRNFDKAKHSFYPTPLTEINANDKL
jgi:hypothetical protein